MALEKATSIEEIRSSLQVFAEALAEAHPQTQYALYHPQYWVYDPVSDALAPSKWAAFRGMTVDQYGALQRKQREGIRTPGFDGTTARKLVARITGASFNWNPELAEKLTNRFAEAFGPDCLKERKLEDYRFLTLPREAPVESAWALQSQIRKELEQIYGSRLAEGGFRSRDALSGYYARFAERFGPEVLQAFDGEKLLLTMHDHGTQDSLVYWIEFKNDDELPAIFGSIAGGSALKFGVYRSQKTGTWVTGSPIRMKEVSVDEAIAIARKHRDQLVAGASLIAELPENGSDDDYAKLQRNLEEVAPDVQDTAWGHKYFVLTHPDKLDEFHVEQWQDFNLIRLLQVPPPTPGRYSAAGRFVALARKLDAPMNHLAKVLVRRNGSPYRHRRLDVGESPEGEALWRTIRDGKVIGFDGREIGDLAEAGSAAALRKKLRETFDWTAKEASRVGRELWNLWKYSSEGDLVLVCRGPTVLGISRILGEYRFEPESPLSHQRPVEWLDLDEWTLKSTEPLKRNLDSIRADFRAQVDIERRLLGAPAKPSPKVVPGPVQLGGTPGRIQRVLERKGQVILYGPPGTGKTYWAERTAKEIAARRVLGRPFDQLPENEKALVFGAGDQGHVRMCSFHPAYGYEDFIEGYRPRTDDGKLSFAVEDGIFRRVCATAADDPERPYFLIIDEINRGDIPRIFGELITVLELSKRGMPMVLPLTGSTLRVPRNLYVIGTMNTADRSIALLDTALRRRFGFIELMPDPAVLGKAEVEGIPLGQWLAALNRRICEHIGRDARNLQVGHSYLMIGGKPVSEFAQFRRILREDVIPLLEEYCYDDWEALGRILGSSLIDSDLQRLREELFEPDRQADLIQAVLSIDPTISAAAQATETTEPEGDEEGEDETDPAEDE